MLKPKINKPLTHEDRVAILNYINNVYGLGYDPYTLYDKGFKILPQMLQEICN